MSAQSVSDRLFPRSHMHEYCIIRSGKFIGKLARYSRKANPDNDRVYMQILTDGGLPYRRPDGASQFTALGKGSIEVVDLSALCLSFESVDGVLYTDLVQNFVKERRDRILAEDGSNRACSSLHPSSPLKSKLKQKPNSRADFRSSKRQQDSLVQDEDESR